MNPLMMSTPSLITVATAAVTSSCATGTLARSGTKSLTALESSRLPSSASLVDEAEPGGVVLYSADRRRFVRSEGGLRVVAVRGRSQLGGLAGSIPFDLRVTQS